MCREARNTISSPGDVSLIRSSYRISTPHLGAWSHRQGQPHLPRFCDSSCLDLLRCSAQGQTAAPRSASVKKRIRKHYSADNLVTLLHGDCLDLLRTIPNGSARLVLTSPPY